jgi:Gpi18-like mannosyltransferase
MNIQEWNATRLSDSLAWRPRLQAARWMWVPVLAFGLTRLGIVLVAYVAASLIADSTPPPYHLRPPDNVLLDVFASRWDTGFYVSIADEGYKYRGVALPSVAFFPLLPLLIRAVTSLVGDPLVAGLIVTNTALLGAMMFLHRLVEDEWGSVVADRTVWYMLIFPTSFFGSAIYSESLFLFGAIGALYFARKGYWESAALLGIAASSSRLIGIVVAPMLLLEWWTQRRRRPPNARPSLAALLAPAAVPLGTVGYMVYLQLMFGDPLAFMHGAAAWAREPRSPLALIAEMLWPPAEGWASAILAGRLPLNNWIDLLTTLFFVALGCVLLGQRRWSEGALVTLGALIPLSSGLLMSQRRYMWVLFPVFILLARWGERPWVDRAFMLFGLLGLGLAVALFANGYWVG